ncbi:MAG: hypothetical protein JO122_07115 [Acetobacteraceae bacterium]|nr:hypothetical protein [Acetobacteraceae bacterium]
MAGLETPSQPIKVAPACARMQADDLSYAARAGVGAEVDVSVIVARWLLRHVLVPGI